MHIHLTLPGMPCTAAAAVLTSTLPAGYEHPLDPLSGEEIRACTAACKQAALQRKLSATLRFNAITAQARLSSLHCAGCVASAQCSP